jgi:hypothetical protein
MLLAPVKGFVNSCILRDERCGLVTAGMYCVLVQIALNGLGGSIGDGDGSVVSLARLCLRVSVFEGERSLKATAVHVNGGIMAHGTKEARLW